MILLGVALPAVLTGALYVAARRSWWAPAVACSAGFVTGFLALEGWPGLPPLEAIGWLPWLAVAAGLVGLTHADAMPRIVPTLARAALAIAVPLLTLRPLLEHSWSPAGGAVRVAAPAVGLLAVWWSVEAEARRAPGAGVPLVFWVVASGSSICIVIAGSARLGQTGGVLAAVFGAGFVAALLGAARTHLGATAVGSVVLGALLINGYFYVDDLPGPATALLAVAPLAVLARRRRSGARATALAVLVAGVTVAVAVALTVAAVPDDPYY